jgi:hypothetical protein
MIVTISENNICNCNMHHVIRPQWFLALLSAINKTSLKRCMTVIEQHKIFHTFMTKVQKIMRD